MKIAGSMLVDAPLCLVWPALLDARVLAACIPGCTGIEVVSPTSYRSTVAMKFGPIEPKFEIEVTIKEIVEGVSITSTTRGQEGSRASLLSSENLLMVRAVSPQSTEVSYSSTVSVIRAPRKVLAWGSRRKTAGEVGRRVRSLPDGGAEAIAHSSHAPPVTHHHLTVRRRARGSDGRCDSAGQLI